MCSLVLVNPALPKQSVGNPMLKLFVRSAVYRFIDSERNTVRIFANEFFNRKFIYKNKKKSLQLKWKTSGVFKY